jgi:2-polyprenyl-3-methyl-5-hydroxy-6-metoxy-1,4-benzoquinol methylase
MDICDAWVPRAVAERVLAMVVEAVEAGTPSRRAAGEIDARLRRDFGADWSGDSAMLRRGVRRVRAGHRRRRAARRVGPVLLRLVPARLRPPLARIHRPLARQLAAVKYRRTYGRRFVAKIHEEDDLLHYSLDVASAEPAFRYYRAVEMYFAGGAWNVAEVEKTLADAGFALDEARSLLEFACGYGRLTRHLVHKLDPGRITVSDIDARGVDFLTAELGVSGFHSARTARQLTHDGRYDMVVVVSLFSHLPLEHWRPWLERLGEMLNPGGVLWFSTGGMHAWTVNVAETDREAFRPKADGFLWREENETRGRLAAEEYGIAYVSNAFVERAVSESFPGRLLRYCPRALNGFQDAYVLQRAGEVGDRSR